MLERLSEFFENARNFVEDYALPFLINSGKVLGICFASLFIGYFIALILGFNISRVHTTETLKTFNYPIHQVWEVISDIETFPEWKQDVSNIEIISDSGQKKIEFLEYYRFRKPIQYQVMSSKENEYLEIKISNSLHPIQGKWVFKLQMYGDKTIMTMKQYSEIDSIFRRYEAKHLDGFLAYSDGILFDIDRRLAYLGTE